MPKSICQEFMRILAGLKAGGRRVAWLSETNRDVLMHPQAQPEMPANSPPAVTPVARKAMPVSCDRPGFQQPAPLHPDAPVAGIPASDRPGFQQPAPLHPDAPVAGIPASDRPGFQRPATTPPPAAPFSPTAASEPPQNLGRVDLAGLQTMAGSCQRCPLHAQRHNVVFGQGQYPARVMFIGEGPGRDEDLQGQPFVGAAGQLLTKMIAAMGLDRYSEEPAKAVYIANIVKCRPPNNRNPEPGEADACLPYLRRQIELVQPQVIILLGAVPLQCLLGINGITRHRGQWLAYGDIPVMPTFHPAHIIRFSNQPQMEREEKLKVWEDLKKVMARLDLPLPGLPQR